MQPLSKARYTTGRIAARLGRIVKRQRLRIHTMTSEIAARSARRVKRKRLKIQTKEKTVSFNQEFHLKRPKLNPSGRNKSELIKLKTFSVVKRNLRVSDIKCTNKQKVITNQRNTENKMNLKIVKRYKRVAKHKRKPNITIQAILLVSMAIIWPETLQRSEKGQLPWIKGQEPRLRAYDCSKTTDNRNIEYHHEKTCVKQDELYVRQRNISAMVIQDTTHVDIPAVRCRLRQASYYAHCGMFSHVTPINYMNSALMDTQISNDDCKRAHSTGYLRLDNGEDYGVKKTGVSTLHVETRGGTWLTDGAGNCLGEEFTAKGSEFNSGIEYIQIELIIDEVTLQLHRNKLYVKDERGVLPCFKEEETCATMSATYMWTFGLAQCSAARTNSFKGLEMTDQQLRKTLISTDGNFIRLRLGKEKLLCGNTVFSTNIENVYIIYSNHVNITAWAKTEFSFDPLSIQNYVMDRDDFILTQLHKEITDVYAQVSNHRCIADHILNARYPVISNAPSMPRQMWRIEGNLFAQNGGQSYYTFRCQEVRVIPRITGHCYNRLPVELVDEPGSKLFLDPDISMVFEKAEIVHCPDRMFMKYKDIDGKWIASAPIPFHTMAPNAFHVRSPIFQVDHVIVGGLVSKQAIDDAATKYAFDDAKKIVANHLTHVVHQDKREGEIRQANHDLVEEAKESVESFGSSLFSPIGNWIRQQETILFTGLVIIMVSILLCFGIKLLYCCADPIKWVEHCCVFCCGIGKDRLPRENPRHFPRQTPAYRYRNDHDLEGGALIDLSAAPSAPAPTRSPTTPGQATATTETVNETEQSNSLSTTAKINNKLKQLKMDINLITAQTDAKQTGVNRTTQ